MNPTRMATASICFIAAALQATTVLADPPPTVATSYSFSPYMDGQVGNGSPGAEGRPVAADGWTGQGRSNLVLSPIGDGSLVMVYAQINLVTDDITAIPNPGMAYNHIVLAGLPTVDEQGLGVATGQFGFNGNFQGIQVDAGALGPNLSIDGGSALNNSYGSRWFVVCSFFNGPPFNAEWAADTSGTFPHTCWLANKDPVTGKTPFRFRGSMWYLTTWAAAQAWLDSQEQLGLVKQINPAPAKPHH